MAGTAGWNAPAHQECLVGARQHRAPDASLPLVHTARRSYRLGARASGLARVASPGAWRKEKS